MKQGIFTIVSNEALTDVVYKMVLEGDTSAITNCGQFVDLRLPEKYLRRPISVCDYDKKTLTLIYKVVGSGTEIMAGLSVGTKLDVLTGLGNGYDTSLSGDRPVLVGGGVGVPPMYNLCKKLITEGKHPQVVLGFNMASEIFLAEEFKALGADVRGHQGLCHRCDQEFGIYLFLRLWPYAYVPGHGKCDEDLRPVLL